MVPLTGVVIYTLIRHGVRGFEEDPGHWVMTPFYKDHTSYGALIALFIPVLIGFIGDKHDSFKVRYSLYFLTIILFVGLYFSFTRAAWVSLAGGLGVMVILRFKINYKYVLFIGILILSYGVSQYHNIIMDLERNKSEHTTEDIEERLESAYNISSDASNLERINRWNSALTMWKNKPVLGYGPGTYAMEYAPHQSPKDRTIISSNFGDRGNAHSEYLGAMAETGTFGGLSFLGIVLALFYTAVQTYHRLDNKNDKRLILVLIVSLTSYFIHSALNNYLDTDKAAVPVWGMVAIIVAYNLALKKHSLNEIACE